MAGWLVAAVLAVALAWLAIGYWAPRLRWRRLFAVSPARHGHTPVPVKRWLAAAWRTDRQPGLRVMLAAASAAGLAGALLGGPVGAAALAAYAAAAVRFTAVRRRRRLEAASVRAAVDAVAALASELRAGLPVAKALDRATASLAPAALVGVAAMSVAHRLQAAVAVAEASGAPLADVLDRLDHHLRSVDRARAGAVAQAAGAAASATLLAVMPVAGAALGFLVGIDPLRILLHTPLGGACLLAAIALQLGGLAWADRLAHVVVVA